MDDGDGAGVVEMMAGQPASAILQTIYSGSKICECGSSITPVQALYTGTLCTGCASRKNADRVRNRMGA